VARQRGEPLIEVRAAAAADWDDVAELFTRPGPRGGTPIASQCWCQYWVTRGEAYWAADNSDKLRGQLRAGEVHALLAYLDGRAVGWSRVGPRASFERLAHSRTLAPVDDVPVWSVVCFYVDPRAKRQGVASALLDAAVDLAREHGAPALEGYAARPHHPNIDSYTGYLPMFLAAGFEHVRDGGRRAIVRKAL
jgi:GNAT superfamily N-acetyltransferase